MSPAEWKFIGMWIAACLALGVEVALNYLILKGPDVMLDGEDLLRNASALGVIRLVLFGLCGILFYCAWL